jgi:hypothetical protein
MGARARLALVATVAVVGCWGWAARADAFVYWASSGSGAIGRANLDGTGANARFIAGGSDPFGIAVDGRHIYWTNIASGAIGRANLDGSGVDQNFIPRVADSRGVAVDGRHVYWTSLGTEAIGRANLDGSAVDPGFIAGAQEPIRVVVDGQRVYWTNGRTNTIGRADLDGSGASQSFIAGANAPLGIAVDGGPAGSAVPSSASLSFEPQPLGTFGPPQSLTIANKGHGNLKIDAARITSGDVDDFLVSHDTCSQHTLTIAATCTVHVRFGPVATGDRQATLTLTSDDPAAPLQIMLEGRVG